MSSDNRVFHGPSAATEWRYLAEGGAHIILRYLGADETLTCKVLRVRKCARAGDSDESVPMYSRSVSSLCFRDAELWADFPALSMGERSELQMRHGFVTNTLQPVLGKQFVEIGELVHVNESFLREVAVIAKTSRPSFRVRESDVDYAAPHALLFRNHSFIGVGSGRLNPTYSIEVKPKCGFTEATSVNGTSRFQMHQALKAAQLQVQNISGYDPLDLFSRLNFNRELVSGQGSSSFSIDERFRDGRRSLSSLIENPQNNLHVKRFHMMYQNNQLVEDVTLRKENTFHGTKLRSLFAHDTWQKAKCSCCDLGIENFVEPLNQNQKTAGRKRFVDLILNALISSGALERILASQRLDKIGVDGAVGIAARLRGRSDVSGAKQNTKQLLRDFITSATAKDCSVMVTIQPASFDTASMSGPLLNNGIVVVGMPTCQDCQISRSNSCEHYLCRVGVVDVDLKSVGKLSRWLMLEGQISATYETRA